MKDIEAMIDRLIAEAISGNADAIEKTHAELVATADRLKFIEQIYLRDNGKTWRDLAEENAKLRKQAALVSSAVSVLQRHLPPDGISDHNALNELYGIFDGPEYRAAI